MVFRTVQEATYSLFGGQTLRGLPVSKPTASAARVLPVPGSPVKRQTVPARSPFLPKPHCPINTALAYTAGRSMKRRQAPSQGVHLIAVFDQPVMFNMPAEQQQAAA